MVKVVILVKIGGRKMKNFKILFVLLGITAITSVGNVFADTTIRVLDGTRIPAHNGSFTTPRVSLGAAQMGYEYNMVKRVSIDPSGDELDARIIKYDPTQRSNWKVLKSGSNTLLSTNPTYTFSSSSFSLQIDSRWYYTKTTTLKTGTWLLTNDR